MTPPAVTMEPWVVDDTELLQRYPDVRLDHDNKGYYRGLLVCELRLNQCGDCGHWHGPPLRPMCPACWSTRVSATPVAGDGVVALVTRLHAGPAREGVSYDPPYPLAAIELVEQPGLRVSGALRVDAERRAVVGQAARLCWEERAGNPYPVFEVIS